MAKLSLKSVIAGTRSGYVIRWTCPDCHAENVIINRTPAEFFKASRDSSCRHCRKRSTIATPGLHQ
ncbi:MAG: hypothetical protein LUQ31_02665 [Methanoregula sp.]|nr:hypothetical protein [Methanoregula sp.]